MSWIRAYIGSWKIAETLVEGFVVIVIALLNVVLPQGAFLYPLIQSLATHFVSIVNPVLEQRKITSENTKYSGEVRGFISRSIAVPVISPPVSGSRQDRVSVYDSFLKYNFPAVDATTRKVLMLLTLCDAFPRLEGSESITLYGVIQQYIDLMGIHKMSEETKLFLRAFKRSFVSRTRVGSLQDLFSGTLSESEYARLLDRFIDEFSKDTTFAFVRTELKQSEELRQTLVELIRNGQFSSYGINEMTLERLQKEAMERGVQLQTYMVLGNKIDKDVWHALKGQPGMGGFRAWSNIPKRRAMAMAGYIFRPTGHYRSVHRYLTEEVESHLEASNEETLLAVVPVDFFKCEVYTIPHDRQFSNANLRKCLGVLEYFRRGAVDDATLWKAITSSRVSTQELLSMIPFNIFVPNICPSEQGFIIRNYPAIKVKLSVATLSDWKDTTAQEIATAVSSCGDIPYDEVEKEDIFGLQPTDVLQNQQRYDRLLKIGTQVVHNSKRFSESLG